MRDLHQFAEDCDGTKDCCRKQPFSRETSMSEDLKFDSPKVLEAVSQSGSPTMPPCVHAKTPVKGEDGKYHCADCGAEMEVIGFGKVDVPKSLEPTWWSKSLLRALLRRGIGITGDIKANEEFLRSIVKQVGFFGQFAKQSQEQQARMGKALNDLAAEVRTMQDELVFYRQSDALRRAYGRYCDWKRVHKPDEVIEQPSLILSGGGLAGIVPKEQTLDFNDDSKSP